MRRREFFATVSLGLAAGLPAINEKAGDAGATNFDAVTHAATSRAPAPPLTFATALEAAAAIRTKQISSVELTQQVFARIDKYNPKLNAFAYQLREDALVRAKQADEVQAHRKSFGRPARRAGSCEREFRDRGASVHVGNSFAEGCKGAEKLRRREPAAWLRSGFGRRN